MKGWAAYGSLDEFAEDGRRYFFEKDGARAGPVDEAELRAMVTSGRLEPDVLVWRRGMEDWTSYAALPDLAAAAVGTADDDGRRAGSLRVKRAELIDRTGFETPLLFASTLIPADWTLKSHIAWGDPCIEGPAVEWVASSADQHFGWPSCRPSAGSSRTSRPICRPARFSTLPMRRRRCVTSCRNCFRTCPGWRSPARRSCVR